MITRTCGDVRAALGVKHLISDLEFLGPCRFIVSGKGAILEADPSRPITAAVRGDHIPATEDPWMRGVVSSVDIMGINYSPFLAATWTQLRPFQPTMGTEMGSCQTDRSSLVDDFVGGYVREDFNADCTPTNGQAVAQGGFYMGSFDWTGFDYRGEPNPTSWPSISSHFGVIDRDSRSQARPTTARGGGGSRTWFTSFRTGRARRPTRARPSP
jgi:hypothetical protein